MTFSPVVAGYKGPHRHQGSPRCREASATEATPSSRCGTTDQRLKLKKFLDASYQEHRRGSLLEAVTKYI